MDYLGIFSECSFWLNRFGVELEMLHPEAAAETRCAGKYLTTGSGTRGQKGICQFPWCKCSHHGLFQPTSRMPPHADLGRDMCNRLFQACTNWPGTPSLLGGAQCFWPKGPSLNKKSPVQWFSILATHENYLPEFLKVRKKEWRKRFPPPQFTYSANLWRHKGKMVQIALYFPFLLLVPSCISTLSFQVPRALIQILILLTNTGFPSCSNSL